MSKESPATVLKQAALVPLPRVVPLTAVIPVPLTSFLGREQEIRDVLALLDRDETRLVTLTGPGGVGKTRLAIEVARRIEADFAHGALFVPLAPIRDPTLVPSAVAQVAGIPDRGDRPAVDRLIAELRDRHLLLVLDNCEHVLSEPPAWLGEVLSRCPRLTVLATSRVNLGIGGEYRYVVPAMPVPKLGEGMTHTAAVELFAQRAAAARTGFTLSENNTEAVMEICRRLDGLPLAIELAAARVSSFTPEEIRSRLTDRLRLLAGGPRDVPIRLRSMRDAVAWSYNLLAPDDQRLFRKLSVFPGGFTLEAAEVVGDNASLDAISVVASLVDASLLQVIGAGGETTRYRMLDTVREFGLHQLEATDELHESHEHLVAWCLHLAARADPYDPTHQISWLPRLELEHDNLRAALEWLNSGGRIATLTSILTQLRWYWYLTGHEEEGLRWYLRLLERRPELTGESLRDVQLFAGQFSEKLNHATTADFLREALSLAEASGDVLRAAEATLYIGLVANSRGDFAKAGALLRRARELFEQVSHAWRSIVTDYHLGVVAFANRELGKTTHLLERSCLAAASRDDEMIAALCCCYLALIACDQGKLDDARALLLRNRTVLHSMALRGAPHLASLIATAVLAGASGRHVTAARLLGAAAGGDRPTGPPERTACERTAADARSCLGDDTYDREWEIGRRMPMEQIDAEIEEILLPNEKRPVPTTSLAPAAGTLTPRELEVLRLMADGLSNRQIAEMLFNSKKTVDNHVTKILGKLGVNTRTAAVSYAFRHLLV